MLSSSDDLDHIQDDGDIHASQRDPERQGRIIIGENWDPQKDRTGDTEDGHSNKNDCVVFRVFHDETPLWFVDGSSIAIRENLLKDTDCLNRENLCKMV